MGTNNQTTEQPVIETDVQPTANFAETSALVGAPVAQPLEHPECINIAMGCQSGALKAG